MYVKRNIVTGCREDIFKIIYYLNNCLNSYLNLLAVFVKGSTVLTVFRLQAHTQISGHDYSVTLTNTHIRVTVFIH